MKTIELKLYNFSELSEEAKKKALDELYDINVMEDWWEWIYGDAKEIGLKITSFDLDRYRHAKGDFILSANEVAQNIFNNHGEQCETYKTAEKFMEAWQPIFNRYMDKESEDYESGDLEDEMIELESEFLNDLLEDYSIMLQKESEYLVSDEAIIETIESNDYLFTEYGKLY